MHHWPSRPVEAKDAKFEAAGAVLTTLNLAKRKDRQAAGWRERLRAAAASQAGAAVERRAGSNEPTGVGVRT